MIFGRFCRETAAGGLKAQPSSFSFIVGGILKWLLLAGRPAGDRTRCGWPPYFHPRRRRVALPRFNCRWRSEVPLLRESSLQGGNIFWRTTHTLIVFLLNRTCGNKEKKRRGGRSGGVKTAVLCISAISRIHRCIYLFIYIFIIPKSCSSQEAASAFTHLQWLSHTLPLEKKIKPHLHRCNRTYFSEA